MSSVHKLLGDFRTQPLHIYRQLRIPTGTLGHQCEGKGDGETPSQVAHLTLTTVPGGWHHHPYLLEEDRLSEAKPFKMGASPLCVMTVQILKHRDGFHLNLAAKTMNHCHLLSVRCLALSEAPF